MMTVAVVHHYDGDGDGDGDGNGWWWCYSGEAIWREKEDRKKER